MEKNPEIVEELKNDSTNLEMAREVAKAIVANKLVLFIGAGFAMNLELPSWKALVEILCNKAVLTDEQRIEIKDLVKYGYLSDALEKIAVFAEFADKQQTHKDELREETMIQFSQHHFEKMGSDKIKNTSLAYKYLSELYRIGAKKIVTTNYDDSIEICLNIKDNVLTLDPAIFDKNKVKIIEEDKYFIKLHGGIGTDKSSMVLFEGDYRNKYILDEQIPNLLQELFTHNRILFLGCGLYDRYMDIYERLRCKKAVMDSYVICTNEEHINVSKRTGIKRIKIDDYCYLDVILEMILWETQKAQREKCKKILFDDLSLENYNYTSAKEFFDQVSDPNVRSCYFFNTQVEFSAWFSPALQIHLCQQMDAYFTHKQQKENKKKDNYEHCRILFLPFDKKEFHINLKSDDTYKHDVKAMVKIHKFMHCEIAFITTDVFKEIIEATDENRSFFNRSANLKPLGLSGLHADLSNLKQKIQRINENGYRKTNDLDFSVIKTDNSKQIWQANYGLGPNNKDFKYSQIEDPTKKTIYETFSGIVIDYLNKHKDELSNPKLEDGPLYDYFNT